MSAMLVIGDVMGELDEPVVSGVAPTLASGERPAAAPTGVGWTGADFDEEEDVLIGQTLSNTYVIERALAEGGMGRVYLARHTRIRRKRLAVKVLHPEYLRKPDVVRRFQREAEAAASIISPHVVSVYDVDETADGRPFMVAELLDGIELGELLEREGNVAIPYAVRIVRQICEAMSVAHEQGVVHRDMKPENVFLTGRLQMPHAKVLDFGISRLADEETKLTTAGTVMGTPAYMPPEQAKGQQVDERADVYAVGAVLYRALTGHAPFERDDPMATMAAIFTEEPPRPRSFQPTIPEHLEAIIQRAMAKDPAQRYASMGELQAVLEPFDTAVEALDESSVAVAATQGQSAKEARLQLVFLLLAAALLGLFGLITAGTDAVRLALGRVPSGGELAVVLLCIVAGGATPIVLAIRHLRATTWNNSARVLDVVEVVRRPLYAAVGVYGAGWLLVGIAGVFSNLGLWPGWSLVWFVGAIAAAGYVFVARKGPLWMRSPVYGLSFAAAGLLCLLIAGASAVEGTPAAVADAKREVVNLAGGDRASDEELEQAGDEVEDLTALAERYPKDRRVLERLFLAHADDSEGYQDAMKVALKLHAADDTALLDNDVRAVIEKAAQHDASRDDALDLLAERMGPEGVDILWDIARGNTDAKAEAQKRLDDPQVRARGTPALRIAYDIDAAEGCAGKAALLDRAAAEGDERTAGILRPLATGARRGCGILGLGACAAPCAGDAARMKKAIAAIEER